MDSTHHRMYELTEQQCRQRLEGHDVRVGRIAFAEDNDPNWPMVLPVNYAYYSGHIFIRTFEGTKLYAALRRQRVAFEIDAIDDGWAEGWSVVAVGALELVDDPEERAAVGAVLHSWLVDAAQHIVRLNIQQLSGRQIIGGSGRAGQ